MKIIITLIPIIAIAGIVWLATIYDYRTIKNNRYQCSIKGYQENCTTPLTASQIECERFYDDGLCDQFGEVYPEYTQEALALQKQSNNYLLKQHKQPAY